MSKHLYRYHPASRRKEIDLTALDEHPAMDQDFRDEVLNDFLDKTLTGRPYPARYQPASPLYDATNAADDQAADMVVDALRTIALRYISRPGAMLHSYNIQCDRVDRLRAAATGGDVRYDVDRAQNSNSNGAQERMLIKLVEEDEKLEAMSEAIGRAIRTNKAIFDEAQLDSLLDRDIYDLRYNSNLTMPRIASHLSQEYGTTYSDSYVKSRLSNAAIIDRITAAFCHIVGYSSVNSMLTYHVFNCVCPGYGDYIQQLEAAAEGY